ncbi:MAG: UTP--glucose-1-phosphate uridylyltransferase GalU [Bacteriovoracaceae bacterium]
MKIKKAIIPIAGKGTRFLPATKQVPKEVIPIINIPMIHYVVNEAVQAGIEQIIFITSYGKESIENYFDRNVELETFLEKNKKYKELELIQNIAKVTEFISVRQKDQLGLGHAVLCAKDIIGEDLFAVLLGDDIVLSDIPVTKQLMQVSEQQNNSSVIGVMEIPKDKTNKYGIVAGNFINNDKTTMKMSLMVEKPSPESAPSNLATPGRYILSSEIFDILKVIPRGAQGEYQLTDAINILAQQKNVYAHKFVGERFDTGSVHGYLDATIDFALRDPELRNVIIDIVKNKFKQKGITI